MLKHLITTGTIAYFTISLGIPSTYAHGFDPHPNEPPLSSDNLTLPENSSVDPRLGSNSIFYGETQSLGQGTVRTWVKLDNNNNPSDIGISFSELALLGLPTESDHLQYPLKLNLLDGLGHSTFEYELFFPSVAASTPFTHISLNWNPFGHGPVGITTVPHFDFHFNLFSPDERDSITSDNFDDFIAKAYKAPPPELIAPGYITTPNAAEPRMGVHYINPTSPEFQRPFDRVFIYGFYNAKMAFWEPMITTAFLQTKPNTTEDIIQPFAYPKSSFYPSTYSINYANQEYSVSLNNFKFRTVPEPNLTFITILFSNISMVFFWKKRFFGFKNQ